MAPNDIRKLIEDKPFRPFRIHMSDGQAVEVRHPSFAFVTKFSVVLGDDYDADGWPTTARHLNIRQITQIETLPTAA